VLSIAIFLLGFTITFWYDLHLARYPYRPAASSTQWISPKPGFVVRSRHEVPGGKRPEGGELRVDLAPLWARAWHKLPRMDDRAYKWMQDKGPWEIPPSQPPPEPTPEPWRGRPVPSELGFVLSPGGWSPPPGVLPAWNWRPPDGARPRLDLVPLWARAWYRLPFIDRYAHAWMWRHAAWEVRPPNTELGHPGGTD
jgi:hypothetical protein